MSRFESLLSLLNLQNRLIFTSQIDDNLLKIDSIDWKFVNNKIAKLRTESYNFLYSTLRVEQL